MGMMRLVTRPWPIHALSSLICWLAATTAVAQTPDGAVSLRWSDDGSCPDDGRTLEDARALAGPDAHGEGLEHFEIRVRALPSGTLEVQLRGDGPQRQVRRTVELPDCTEARRATSLLVALALNPEAALAPPPRPEPEPEPEPEAAASADGPRLELGFRVSLATQILPSATGDLGIAAAAMLGAARRWRLELGIDYLLPRTLTIADRGKQIRVGLWRVTGVACHLWPVGSVLSVGPCAGLAVGRIDGQSEGVANPGADAALWFAPQLGLQAGLKLGPMVLRISADAAVPLRRPHFQVRSVDKDFHVPGVGFWTGIGVFLPF